MKRSVNLSKIMSNAWIMAREGSKRFGGSARLYFSSALSTAWQEEKTLAIITETKPATIYHKGLGNRFLLPGVAMPVSVSQNGQCNLPGIRG